MGNIIQKKIRIAVTVGDPNGIGPEIILKALAENNKSEAEFIILGPKQLFLESAGTMTSTIENYPELSFDLLPRFHFNEEGIVFAPLHTFQKNAITLGRVTQYGGLIAGESLSLAIKLAQEDKVDAIVTAPLSKESLNMAGYNYPGHTEFLADGFGVDDVVMLMVSDHFRVGLVTTHCALRYVPELISIEMILTKLKIIDNELKSRFNITNPKIAVSALNPHGGEAGLFGNEENDVIMPAIDLARSEGIAAVGPFPGDTLFVETEKKQFDAYLAMYHDQGLIPIKQKYFGKVVNYTAGLPIVRTSPDHGTAFDIAGRNCASPTSLIEAIQVAAKSVSKN